MTPTRPTDADRRAERRRYILGLAAAVGLTLAAFAAVGLKLFSGSTTLFAIAFLALLQIAAHFYFFLHIDPKKSHRDDLMLVLFTGLIVSLMVGGTLWILWDQWSRMAVGH